MTSPIDMTLLLSHIFIYFLLLVLMKSQAQKLDRILDKYTVNVSEY